MASLKTCFKCSAEKPLTEFYRHPMMADGHLNKCKDCAKRDVREHRAANESVREYDRKRANLPHRQELAKKIRARWLQRHPERRKAHLAVQAEVSAGRMKRLPCQVCGAADPVEAHHEDYSKPLDVVWLCVRHHRMRHAEMAKEDAA